MRFIPFIYKYKYYVSLLVFLVTCIIVGLLWENYSGSIIVNLLVPVASLLLTIFITMIIERQNGSFGVIHKRFIICNAVTVYGDFAKEKKSDKLKGAYRLIDDEIHQHFEVVNKNIKDGKRWKKKFFRNFPKKVNKIEKKVKLEIEKHMTSNLKQEFEKRFNEDLRYSRYTSIFLLDDTPETSFIKMMNDESCKTEPNTFSMNFRKPYFLNSELLSDSVSKKSEEYIKKTDELKKFILTSNVNHLISRYKRTLWRYYKVTKRNVKWFHKLYMLQFHSLIQDAEDFDDMKKNLDNVVSQIQESITDQTSELDDIITNSSKELEEMTADIVNRAAEEIIDEIKSE